MTAFLWRLVDYWLFPQERPGNKQIRETAANASVEWR